MISGKKDKFKLQNILASCLNEKDEVKDDVDGFLIMIGNNLRQLQKKTRLKLQNKFLNETYEAMVNELEQINDMKLFF